MDPQPWCMVGLGYSGGSHALEELYASLCDCFFVNKINDFVVVYYSFSFLSFVTYGIQTWLYAKKEWGIRVRRRWGIGEWQVSLIKIISCTPSVYSMVYSVTLCCTRVATMELDQTIGQRTKTRYLYDMNLWWKRVRVRERSEIWVRNRCITAGLFFMYENYINLFFFFFCSEKCSGKLSSNIRNEFRILIVSLSNPRETKPTN